MKSASCGRPAEAIGRLRSSKWRLQPGLQVKRPKNGKSRPCQLPQSALAALRFHKEQQQEHRRLFATDYKDLDLIFCEPNGDHRQPTSVETIAEEIGRFFAPLW